VHQVYVCYGHPTDPAGFDEYYERTHADLAKKVPGLVRFTIGKVEAMGGGEPPYYVVATLGFESAESMAAGLASPEMAAAGADVANFATGGATMFRAPETVLIG